MKKKKIIIATVKTWNIEAARDFRKHNPDISVRVITKRDQVCLASVKKFNPDFIFFPHWSWKIPRDIYAVYPCVAFHMTDLPYGRGGSPLQNLIVRGHRSTKITAIRVTEKFDSGPVYIKHALSLRGAAEEIYRRAAAVIFGRMIPAIIRGKMRLRPQKGKAVVFRRRTPEESRLIPVASVPEAYDRIRMLDAEGYPRAFLETTYLRFEFFAAEKKGRRLTARVEICPKEAA
ncbi:MAG TPA: formyltransferase family protein [Candidatus Omnitrophota bacterium]|nr:methionyl-tRNA formyltransferase [Candidatus Omnitrophota bacterium]HPB67316.1 formyltransferase family protein [Candidatus Omnitrophota bacterium]HQO58286.1 formyltransferase family protein [Candidatus Omnitrophota bacterium]HQP11423.1 formyltransferase family protein [Candidatus Omnitrophota bacterium]